MAASKCWLCNRRLKGGEGQLKLINGTVRKICVDIRGCELRQKMKKKEQAQNDDTETSGAVSNKLLLRNMAATLTDIFIVEITALITFVLGLAVGKFIL